MLNSNAMPDDLGMPSNLAGAGNTADDDATDDAPPERESEDASALAAVAAAWQRRGYQIRYSDPFLIQLIRRDRLGWRSGPFLALAIATLIASVAAFIVALQRRPWHVVTLVIGPDRRVLTHHHHAPHPPAP